MKESDNMKRIMLLIIVAITLTGCSNNDSEDLNEVDEQNNEDELIVEQKDLNTDTSKSEEESNFEVMLKEFLVDSYEESSFTDFRHSESILSEELLETMYENQQSSQVHFDEDERIIHEFELFSSSDNPNRYIYRAVLEIDKSHTEHYGEVITINESGEQKIEELREINMNEL